MRAEAKELYVFTIDHFTEEIKRISPECVSPLIAVRKVVKRAIGKYISDYCNKGDEVFSQEDFTEVSNKIYAENFKQKVKNVAEEFSNKQAFETHFKPIVIEKSGKRYYVYTEEEATKDFPRWIQEGTKEYINGWMYGAVQTVCGQIQKKEG